MAALDEMDNHRTSYLPHFKQPIKLRELAGSKRVIFEIDQTNFDNDAFLEDDDPEIPGGDEESHPVTETDPKRYVAGRKTRPLLESFGVDPEMGFDTFYDKEKMAAMTNVEENGGVRKTIVRPGNGPNVPENCKVFVHYVICGDGMNEPFDSTINRGFPHCIDLRAPDVIPGLYAAIQSMKIREVAKVWIRYDLAYGLFGCPPRIPPSCDLLCVIEVLDVIEENQLKLVPYMSSDERAALEFSEIHEAAKVLRCEGNGDYRSRAFYGAIKKYRKAANILEDYGTKNQEDQDSRQELLYTLYMNLSACYLELKRPQQVCIFCQLALRSVNFSPQRVGAKLYYRFAEAKLMLGHPKEAQNLNSEALRRSPKEPQFLEQKKKIAAELETERLAIKMTYAKIGKAICSSSSSSGSSTSTAQLESESSTSSSEGSTEVILPPTPANEMTPKTAKEGDKLDKIPENVAEPEPPAQNGNGVISPPFELEWEAQEAAFIEPQPSINIHNRR